MIKNAEEFMQLRYSDDPQEYRRTALEPAEVSTWIEIINLYPEMKKWVAHNKTVPMSIVRTLASDSDPSIRSMIARKRNIDEPLLMMLAKDEEESVRRAVLFNPKVSISILSLLSKDNDQEISEIALSKLKITG